jgi:hypothetical protein
MTIIITPAKFEARTIIELEEGLLHYADMSAEDVATAEAIVAKAGGVSAYTIGSDQYVGFLNADGEAVVYFYNNRVGLTGRCAWRPEGNEFGETRPAPVGSEPDGIEILLSTWVAQGEGNGAPKVTVTDGVRTKCVMCEERYPVSYMDALCRPCERAL